MFILILSLIVVFVIYIIGQTLRPPNFPPGPSWLPYVGNLPMLRKLSRQLGGQHIALVDLSRKYNTNVLGLKLGKDYVVAVFSYSTIRTVLTGEEYEGRPDNFFMRLRTMGTRKGITCTDGELWQVQRNFVVRHLRNLGFGKKPMEEKIKEEIAEVLELIEKDGPEIRLGKLLAPAVLNILWALTSGSRIQRSDPRLNTLLDLLGARSKVFDMSGGTLTQHPWLRYIAPEKTGYNIINELNRNLRKLFMDTIDDHYKKWTEGRDDDLMYAFISEMKGSGPVHESFTADQLAMVCLDLFIAGSQTTSNTLDFAFLMMILYPEIQVKVQTCLDAALETGIHVEYSDKNKVPYVEAVLMEVQRYCHVTPITGPRRVLKDTVLEGYHIPKNTTVLISMYSIHRDKSYWKDPDTFRPERFLSEDGKLLPQERLIPFGLGKRRCLGESLAKNCIFVFFTEIMRRYTISVANGSARPTGIPLPGITLTPENYKAILIRRT